MRFRPTSPANSGRLPPRDQLHHPAGVNWLLNEAASYIVKPRPGYLRSEGADDPRRLSQIGLTADHGHTNFLPSIERFHRMRSPKLENMPNCFQGRNRPFVSELEWRRRESPFRIYSMTMEIRSNLTLVDRYALDGSTKGVNLMSKFHGIDLRLNTPSDLFQNKVQFLAVDTFRFTYSYRR